MLAAPHLVKISTTRSHLSRSLQTVLALVPDAPGLLVKVNEKEQLPLWLIVPC